MYQFWETIVEPALLAAEAKRVIEIGALRGEMTVRLLDRLGPESELHVIDPVPIFDPNEHARRFPGRYVFHRGISHDVLPELPAADAALVDGDHNWYTVYNELRMLRETARGSGSPLPLLILHDVCWPYGRRDLYYAPERIPEEFRQSYGRGGLLPGDHGVTEARGLNQHVDNALREGGERNGVMTALDDFIAEHDRPVRRLVVPIYHGLALVADQDRLEASPKLVEFFDRIESSAGRYELLQLAESIRLDDQIQQHEIHFRTTDQLNRGANRYLELLKGALLDLHYLENELRIGHLLECIEHGKTVSPLKLGDPARYMSKELGELRQTREAGEPPGRSPDRNGVPEPLSYTEIGRSRLDQLEHTLDTIRLEAISGDLVDCGHDRGGTAVFLRAYLDAYEMAQRNVYVASRFDVGTVDDAEGAPTRFAADLNAAREAFERFGLLDERVRFLQGPPAETVTEPPIRRLALIRIDVEDPEQVHGILEALYDRLSPGGYVVVDDYWTDECRATVETFRDQRGIADPVHRVDWSGAWWRKSSELVEPPPEAERPPSATRRSFPAATKELSVVVVAHNMRREAPRTLYSLSPRYQQGLGDLDYEVIVVENGSDPDQVLGEELVASYGPQFRYIDLGEGAAPSPANALNRGLGESRGRDVALMIDGAHVLTPGVLRMARLAMKSYAPAVVTTQQWYVGPGEQNEAVAKGYDAAYEDRLFAQIGWPINGYRLFEVGHFIGDRDWFDGQWESNCVFMPRELLEQIGALDERFSMPGGGYVNLDFFERVANAPGVNLVTLLGEGSFHQVHGGTTTNLPEIGKRAQLIGSYDDHYSELRGRRFRVPAAEIHYIGSLPEAARRTKPRRMGAPEYFKHAHVVGTDGRPKQPTPIPAELRTEFVDAFWRSQEWKQTPWLGKWTGKPPTDLFAYQELIWRVRPDWVIETGTQGGTRAFFLATICDLLGNGQVLSIDDYPVEKLAEHPRITYLRKDPTDSEAAAEARKIVGEKPRAMVILAAGSERAMTAAFSHYGPLVPVGSYVVVEDTILNGHPVWTGFGPGPHEAAGAIARSGQFEVDLTPERYGVTFNPKGFLKRTARADS